MLLIDTLTSLKGGVEELAALMSSMLLLVMETTDSLLDNLRRGVREFCFYCLILIVAVVGCCSAFIFCLWLLWQLWKGV